MLGLPGVNEDIQSSLNAFLSMLLVTTKVELPLPKFVLPLIWQFELTPHTDGDKLGRSLPKAYEKPYLSGPSNVTILHQNLALLVFQP